MNANVPVMIMPEKGNNAALPSSSGNNIKAGDKDTAGSFSKVFNEISDKIATADKAVDKTTEKKSPTSDKTDTDAIAYPGLLIFPIEGLAANKQQTESTESVETLLAANAAGKPAVSTADVTAGIPVDIGNQNMDDSQGTEVIEQSRTVAAPNNDLSTTGQHQTLTESTPRGQQIQSLAAAQILETPIVETMVDNNKKIPDLGVKIQTGKFMNEDAVSPINDIAMVGAKLSEDISKVQYSAYGMKLVPGKQNRVEKSADTLSLEKPGNGEQLKQPFVESLVAAGNTDVDNIAKDKNFLPAAETDNASPTAAALEPEIQNKGKAMANPNGAAKAFLPHTISTQKTDNQDIKQTMESNPVKSEGEKILSSMPDNKATAVDFSRDATVTEHLLKSMDHTDQSDTVKTSTRDVPVISQVPVQVQKNDGVQNLADAKTVGPNTADKYNVVAQVVEQAKLINRDGNSEMVIQLKPEHLGELTLKVSVDNGVVNTTFHSNNSEVRSVIESSLNQLRQELSNQGLKVNYVGVYAGLSQFSSQQQRENQPQPVYKFQNKKQVTDQFDEVVDIISQAKTINSPDGIDYLV